MKKSFLIIGLLIGLSSIGNAQERIKMTVEDAIQTGLKNSKTLDASSMKVVAAEARSKEVFAGLLPAVKFNAGYRRLSEVDPFKINTPFGNFVVSPSILDNYTTQLTVSQPLFAGLRLLSSSKIADKNYEASKEDFQKDQSDLIYNIQNAYWNLFKAEQMKKVIDENLEMIQAHVNDATNLLNAGLLTQNDKLKLEVQLSDAQLKQLDASNNVRLAMIGLNNVLSIPLTTEIEIVSEVKRSEADFGELNTLVNAAIEERPEVKAAKLRVKAAEYGVTAARAGWYPQISVSGNLYYSRPNQRIVPAEDKFNSTWDVGVNLSMSIWDWLTTAHQTEQAKAQLAQGIDALGIIKDGVSLEVNQYYLLVNQSKRRIELSELTVKQAEENMRVTSERFKGGTALSTDAIDAEVSLLSAKINYTNSLVDFELSKARLKKALGKE
ncbi:MAG: TolC family protein [Ignavibacteriaceae bacterium]|jgi:outer membrane protein TolC|nr:TolC family protein [Ignavibacteriaceae bacterium]